MKSVLLATAQAACCFKALTMKWTDEFDALHARFRKRNIWNSNYTCCGLSNNQLK
jgi:hypothetical protein